MISIITLLDKKLREAGIPFFGVSGNEPPFIIDFAPEATQEEIGQAAVIVSAFDPVAEVAAVEAEEEVIRQTPISARQWFAANPNAKLIWSMSVAEIVTEIAALVDISFPAPATAATRTKWKLLLTAITLIVKILVKRERLDDV